MVFGFEVKFLLCILYCIFEGGMKFLFLGIRVNLL